MDLPKPPKVADLADAVMALDGRVGALEEYVAANDGRIGTLETRQTTESGRVRETLARERWLRTLRRR